MHMQTPVNSATLNAIDLELFLNPENVYGKRGQNDTFSWWQVTFKSYGRNVFFLPVLQ